MKKILTILITIFMAFSLSYTSAEVGGTITRSISGPKIYKTIDEFIKSEGKQCEVATDGCNTILIKDGQAGPTTLMMCNKEVEYSCTKYKEEPKMCTMEYMPVCGIDGKTYGNKCMAGNTEIVYENICNDLIDSKKYLSYKNNDKYVSKINKIITGASDKALEKVIVRIDKLIENTKKTRIARQIQIEKITIYSFLRDLIIEKLYK